MVMTEDNPKGVSLTIMLMIGFEREERMNKEIIASVIDHLDIYNFEELCYYILKKFEYPATCKRLDEIDRRIIEKPPERYYQCAEAFFLNFYPYSLYRNFTLKALDLSELKNLVTKYFKKRSYGLWVPVDGTAVYAISNYDSRKLGITDEKLLEYYIEGLSPIIPEPFEIGIGNINTILNSNSNSPNNYDKLIEQYFIENDSGICINLSDDRILASRYIAEKEFNGILLPSKAVFQPLIKKVLNADDVLAEFNEIINSSAKESVLEEFLCENYQLIFGEKYDTISTQVWLNFPELDIGGRERRLDIFMKNVISQDWDIYELKRSNIKLTKTISDVPRFMNAVNDAIAQLKNYQCILNQDAVRKKFKGEGIEYYNPQINLVIGKRPNLPTNQWRWLLSQHQDLNILTYDDLLKEAKLRLNSMKKLLA